MADTLGLMLALIWTAGFLPGFLDARSISVLLAKPAPRWVLICRQVPGRAGLRAVQCRAVRRAAPGRPSACGPDFGTRPTCWSIPLLLLHFSIFFGFSVLLAVCTRSAVVCVFGSLVFWCVAWSMNFGRHALFTSTDMVADSAALAVLQRHDRRRLLDPAQAGRSGHVALRFAGCAAIISASCSIRQALAAHGFSMMLSVLSSLAFAAVVLFASVRTFRATDY